MVAENEVSGAWLGCHPRVPHEPLDLEYLVLEPVKFKKTSNTICNQFTNSDLERYTVKMPFKILFLMQYQSIKSKFSEHQVNFQLMLGKFGV